LLLVLLLLLLLLLLQWRGRPWLHQGQLEN
jgi:hypothetical protein